MLEPGAGPRSITTIDSEGHLSCKAKAVSTATGPQPIIATERGDDIGSGW